MEEHGENFVGFFSLFSVCKNKNNIASIEKANVDEKKNSYTAIRKAGRQAMRERKKRLVAGDVREREGEEQEEVHYIYQKHIFFQGELTTE